MWVEVEIGICIFVIEINIIVCGLVDLMCDKLVVDRDVLVFV